VIDRIFAAPRGESLEQGLAFAKLHNLDYEIPTATFFPTEPAQMTIERYQKAMEDFSGLVALHGPYEDLNVASGDPDIAAISQQRYLQTIEIAKALKLRYVVFHSQWTPALSAKNTARTWLSKMTDFWEQVLAEHLEGSQTTVLIENYLEPTPEHTVKLLSRINSSHLKACLDTGHANLFSQCSPEDWIHDLGSQVVYIHAHNNGGETDSHDPFDKGILDMDSFLNHIALLPQKLHLCIETASLEALESSYAKVAPYLQLQNEHIQSKSFLI
jgi:sugar phosphate isomerase/epimerase